jgi:hypothetical protein
MIASLDDFSSLHHDDIISLAYGLEPMSDDDDSTISEEFIECNSDRLF